MNDRIDSAFRTLRAHGMIARKNFRCCSSCAGAALATQVEKSPKRDEITGAVYYHEQDAELAEDKGKLYLRFSGVDGKATLTQAQVGLALCEALRSAGLSPVWDGNPNECVIVEGV